MNALRSQLFECLVRHERFVPKAHAFAYRLFYLALDLDELEVVDRRLRWLSVNRRNVASFHEADYLPVAGAAHNPTRPPAPQCAGVGEGGRLKDRVTAWCAAHGFDVGPEARVVLITLPRVCGYHFNPVSFYLCFSRTGEPRVAIAEVTNTFREVKPYVLPPQRESDGGTCFRLRTPKRFYVSPFSDLDAAFDFTVRLRGERLAVRIDDYEAGRRTLHSTLTGRARPLSDGWLTWLLCKYPLVTLRVIALIHWHAFQLWRKRVPFFRKAAAPERQSDLFRPHASLLRRSS